MIKNDTRKQVIIIAAYIFIVFALIAFQYGFYIYHLTPFLWEKTSATIISEDMYVFQYRLQKAEVINQGEVEFYIDGQIHHGLVFMSSKEKEGDTINIASLKSNPNKCIRYEWLPLSIEMKIITAIQLIIIAIDWIVRTYKRHKEYRNGSIVNISSRG